MNDPVGFGVRRTAFLIGPFSILPIRCLGPFVTRQVCGVYPAQSRTLSSGRALRKALGKSVNTNEAEAF